MVVVGMRKIKGPVRHLLARKEARLGGWRDNLCGNETRRSEREEEKREFV